MILTVDEVKTHLRIQHDEEDACIERADHSRRRPPQRTTAAFPLKRKRRNPRGWPVLLFVSPTTTRTATIPASPGVQGHARRL